MSRILFLEIEGVLVHEISRRTDLLLLGPDPKRFDNGFKPSINALNQITETTKAQVIVTSHWSSMGVGVLEDRLKQWGMKGRMADVVPAAKTRAEQITKWFDLTKRPESHSRASSRPLPRSSSSTPNLSMDTKKTPWWSLLLQADYSPRTLKRLSQSSPQ